MKLKTNNYDMFFKHENNREINQSNLVRVINSIKACNLLELRPILVNGKMQVIDGQHRLEAARYLGVDIFYEIREEASVEEILVLNNCQKGWTREDWLKFYVSIGVEDYIKLDEFCRTNNLSLSESIRFLQAGVHKEKGRFKTGTWKYPEKDYICKINETLQKAESVLELVERYFLGNKKFIHQATFKTGLVLFLNRDDVCVQVFKNKLLMRIDIIRQCVNLYSYYKMFTSIYNWKNHSPITV